MSEREWKPGDVAMVRGDVCLRTHQGTWEHGRADIFAYDDYEHAARPLVVIDPEDAGQVKRLAEAYDLALQRAFPDEYDSWPDLPSTEDDRLMAAALREFANPTPPECGRHLTVDLETGREGRHDHYVCRKPKGHDGRHEDTQAATTWEEGQ